MLPRLAWASLILLVAAPAQAQFCVGPFPPRGYGFGYTSKQLILTGAFARFGYGYGYGYGFGPGCFFGQPCLPFGPAYYDFAVVPIVPPTIVVQPPPLVVVPSLVPPFQDDEQFGAFRPNPGGVAALRPRRIAPAPVVEPAPKRPMPAADDPLAQGREAFALGQYGRAVERFRRAADADPNDAEALVLLAAARFAMGKYPEAVADFNEGLKRSPGLPTLRTRDLYRGNDPPYQNHMDRLQAASDRDPDDVTLRYFHAVQLWLDGKRDEARAILRKLLPLVADPVPVRRFLDEPDRDIVKR